MLLLLGRCTFQLIQWRKQSSPLWILWNWFAVFLGLVQVCCLRSRWLGAHFSSVALKTRNTGSCHVNGCTLNREKQRVYFQAHGFLVCPDDYKMKSCLLRVLLLCCYVMLVNCQFQNVGLCLALCLLYAEKYYLLNFCILRLCFCPLTHKLNYRSVAMGTLSLTSL